MRTPPWCFTCFIWERIRWEHIHILSPIPLPSPPTPLTPLHTDCKTPIWSWWLLVKCPRSQSPSCTISQSNPETRNTGPANHLFQIGLWAAAGAVRRSLCVHLQVRHGRVARVRGNSYCEWHSFLPVRWPRFFNGDHTDLSLGPGRQHRRNFQLCPTLWPDKVHEECGAIFEFRRDWADKIIWN